MEWMTKCVVCHLACNLHLYILYNRKVPVGVCIFLSNFCTLKVIAQNNYSPHKIVTCWGTWWDNAIRLFFAVFFLFTCFVRSLQGCSMAADFTTSRTSLGRTWSADLLVSTGETLACMRHVHMWTRCCCWQLTVTTLRKQVNPETWLATARCRKQRRSENVFIQCVTDCLSNYMHIKR